MELQDQIEAKDDLIGELEDNLEQSKFQVQTILSKINEDGEKHQMEVKTLLDLNNNM